MRTKLHSVLGVALLCVIPAVMRAQADFTIEGRPVQIHSFASQGFAYSDSNNFLTMDTSKGSFAFTDVGANISTQLTDKFRIGAQVYSRNIGQLGNWHPTLDWAVADYRFKDWFGIRGGKVKTVMGLYTDTQHAESLHTWAILPQAMYPLDLRATTNAHEGADVYGTIPLQSKGSLAYTAYWGVRPVDKWGGSEYSLIDAGMKSTSFDASIAGTDLRWNTPVDGLVIGFSWGFLHQDIKGGYKNTRMNYESLSDPQHISSYYAEFNRGKWRLATEFRRNYNMFKFTLPILTAMSDSSENEWFGSVAYRISKRVEVGTYHSRYYSVSSVVNDPSSDHIFDQAATVRFDLTRFSSLKIEGHFMDGYGNPWSSHGFYARTNPGAMDPKTNMLIVRLGFAM